MSRIGRVQSLKSPRDKILPRNVVPPDQPDAHPPPTTKSSFSNFFRRSKEVKSSEEEEKRQDEGNDRRGSSTSTGMPRDPPPSRLTVPRDSLIINAPDSQRRYFMGHQSRGVAVIINNKKFERSLKQAERVGTDVDADALEEVFLNLGFTRPNIHRYNDVPHRHMLRLMDHYACKTDYEEMDCFFCVLLSHGTEGGVIFGYDGKTTLDVLLDPFKRQPHPTLIGKPKIFLIQACRGDQFENGVLLRDSVEADGPAIRIPLESDFIYAYSTVPGYFSWRNAAKGSWFIEAFAKNVKKYRQEPEMDLIRLLTRVNYDVAYDYQSNVPLVERMHLKKQMPSIVSMLTKELYFF
ncbi:Caspase-3 [Hypsibius exemplaris]|uniref:Caspase-3 n=1 Tax=Hypsibius exemplaris TaxID=2072580 RepID=A0A1W0X6A1_HYPEX|nr:Caspase-3 [Hypsibius exemplaris]